MERQRTIGVDHGNGPGRDGRGLLCVCEECTQARIMFRRQARIMFRRTEIIMNDDLETRVNQFLTLELPGQPMAMHMGTMSLVNDLWREVQRLRALHSPRYHGHHDDDWSHPLIREDRPE